MSEQHFLQNRWMVENNSLYYYGLRNKENLFKNSVKLTSEQKKVISSLPKEISEKEISVLQKLIGTQIVTED